MMVHDLALIVEELKKCKIQKEDCAGCSVDMARVEDLR